ALVFAEDDGAVWQVVFIFVLPGKNQGAIPHGDTFTRTIKHKFPLRIFDLGGYVNGSRPGGGVILAFYQHQLPGVLLRWTSLAVVCFYLVFTHNFSIWICDFVCYVNVSRPGDTIILTHYHHQLSVLS